MKLKLKISKQLLSVLGFVGLGLLVGIAGLLLAVLPQQSHTASLDRQIAAAQQQFASLHAQSHRGPDVHAAELFQLSRAMPDNTDMASIIDDLSRAAAASSTTILALQPGAPISQTDGSVAIPLKLSVTGSWRGISLFLHTLRNDVRVGKKSSLNVSGRLFVVDNVALTASGVGSASSSASGGSLPSGELSASLSVDAFSYGTPAPPASTDTTSTSTSATTTTSTPPGSAVASGSTG